MSNKMFSGLVWSGIQRISIDAASFILAIVLARILSPKEYGTIGILLVFIALANVFIDSGFTMALIQKQDRTEKDKSTLFFFNMLIATACYALLFFTAPYIADFYEIEKLSDLLRVLALVLLINAFFTVPNTLLVIDMDFKTLAKINLTATVISGLTAIFMAYNGFGVWALVFQHLIKAIINAILMWIIVKWKPLFIFSRNSFNSFFKFGSNYLASSLLNTGVNHFAGLYIAKSMSIKDLGFYTQGTQYVNVVSAAITSILNSVLLPGLSELQDKREELVSKMKTIIGMTALVTLPIFLLLAMLAEPIIKLLLTDKWLPAVPIMQVFCLARFITIICRINVNLLYVIGRTDLELKQQYFKITIRVLFLLVGLQFGIVYVALAELLATSIHFFINTYYPGKIMNYGASKQLNDMKVIFLSGFLMLVVTFIPFYFIENIAIKIGACLLTGVLSYWIFVQLFKITAYKTLIAQAMQFLKKD